MFAPEPVICEGCQAYLDDVYTIVTTPAGQVFCTDCAYPDLVL